MQSNYQDLYGKAYSRTNILAAPLQTIYYGAPGTGKSYKVENEILANTTSEQVFRTTFHPDYDYASFVGCYKPTKTAVQPELDIPALTKILSDYNASGVTRPCQKFGAEYWNSLKKLSGAEIKTLVIASGYEESLYTEVSKGIAVGEYLFGKGNSAITYSFVPQVFTNAYIKAWQNPEMPVYLVIEEINRGNCAQIFGDLFQLLDRKDGKSDYPVDADEDLKNYLIGKLGEDHQGIKDGKLCLPPNLNILATMNTSDQSLFPMDSAFKRRWEWEYIPINHEDAKQFTVKIDDTASYNWDDVITELNKRIFKATSSPDKQLGNRFVKADANNEISAKVFVNKVMFYLWSEVYKDYADAPTETIFVTTNNNPTENDVFTFEDLADKSRQTELLKKFFEVLGIENKAKKTEEPPAAEE